MIQERIAALQDEKAEVRAEAAKVLGFLRDKRAVEPLTTALQGEEAEVCMAAAWALGEILDVHAIEPLKKLAQRKWNDQQTDLDVGITAMRALNKFVDMGLLDPSWWKAQ